VEGVSRREFFKPGDAAAGEAFGSLQRMSIAETDFLGKVKGLGIAGFWDFDELSLVVDFIL